MKRIMIAFIVSLIIPALSWVAGFDFDERGGKAVSVALLWIWAWWMAWFMPINYPGAKWEPK